MSLRELEAELVSEKHWTLRGEVSAGDRPTDSLLGEGAIEFNLSGRAAQSDDIGAVEGPGAAESGDLEAQLASIIKKRVGLQLWDDVKPRTVVNALVPEVKLSQVLEEAPSQKSGKTLVDEYAGLHVTQTGASINVRETEAEAERLWENLERKLNQYCMV